ncbi:hypothetical protein [Actinomadura roseirufa]|uniref:hypothetical protein n=1 Tax=Actinomadura roseirufa TaxID=2094049 RepID=UPI0010413667|nr:hypothetical protein [Actinomadura roseirufa]
MTNTHNLHQLLNDAADNALTVAERSFQLLITGPQPLAIDGHAVGHGLPHRPVDLGELRTLLLKRSASDELKDAAWRQLVQHARSGDPAWTIGCVGMAMPGLKNTAARVLRTSPAQLADDIVSELLTEFVAQLTRIDLTRRHIAARLMLWARKGAQRARGRELRHMPCDPHELPDHGVPANSAPVTIDPIALVLEAARQEIVSPSAAELIIATRLDGTAMQDPARDRGVPVKRLYKQRQVAEARVVAAIKDGRISAMSVRPAGGI